MTWVQTKQVRRIIVRTQLNSDLTKLQQVIHFMYYGLRGYRVAFSHMTELTELTCKKQNNGQKTELEIQHNGYAE